jgi:hypothetical protein
MKIAAADPLRRPPACADACTPIPVRLEGAMPLTAYIAFQTLLYFSESGRL